MAELIYKPRAKKFTFVYPDFEYTVTKNGYQAKPGGWYHEGIAQLSSILESKGWEVSLVHLTTPVTKEEFIKELEQKDPSIIGFSIRTGVKEYGKDLVNWANEVDAFKLVGSYHASLWPEEVISWEGVDAICIGEGEKPMMQFIETIENGKDINKIGSFWIKQKNGEIIKNEVQPLLNDLNTLPLPKFEIFDFNKLAPSQIKSAVVVLTRGCPYQCAYCWNNFARNLYPNKNEYIRARSPENCIKYIKKLFSVYPDVKFFRFQDDLWPFHNDWFEKFSKLYIEEIHTPFECHLRANLLTEEIIKQLKSMQCAGVYLGVESGNDNIRNNILKRFMSDKVLITAFLTSKKYGIKTHAYNIVGMPHETMKTVLDTVKLNGRLQPTDMFFPVFFPYAGTDLYKIAVESGYYDPKKPLQPDVNIEMPDFKKNQILFAHYYSKTFVRLYQFVFTLPESISKILEKILDSLWLFPYWPFRVMNFFIIAKRTSEEFIKQFIKKHFFGLYLALKR